jgi:hypothetical protein
MTKQQIINAISALETSESSVSVLSIVSYLHEPLMVIERKIELMLCDDAPWLYYCGRGYRVTIAGRQALLDAASNASQSTVSEREWTIRTRQGYRIDSSGRFEQCAVTRAATSTGSTKHGGRRERATDEGAIGILAKRLESSIDETIIAACEGRIKECRKCGASEIEGQDDSIFSPGYNVCRSCRRRERIRRRKRREQTENN